MDLRTLIKNTPFRVIVSFLLAFLSVYLLWVFPFEHVLNEYFSDAKIKNYFNFEENITTSIENISYKTNLDFSVNVHVSHFCIKDGQSDVVNVQNLNAKINIFPLIINSLSIKDFDVALVQLNIVKNENGEINIFNLLKKDIKKTRLPKFSKLSLNIGKYQVQYVDKKLKNSFSFTGDKFNIKKYESNKLINLFIDGEIFTISNNLQVFKNGNYSVKINSKLPLLKNINRKDFELELDIKNLDLRPFSLFVSDLKSLDIVEVDGQINADIRTTYDENDNSKRLIGKVVTSNLLLKEKIDRYNTYLKEKTNIDFDLKLLKNSIFIDAFSLKNIYHKVLVSGFVNHTNTAKPYLDLKLNFYNDKRSMLYNALPSKISFEKNLVSKVKKYQPKAILEGELKIKGYYRSPDIDGEVVTDDLYFDMPNIKDSIAKLKFIFQKKKLQIVGYVDVDKNSKVDIDGSLNIYGEKNAIFHIKSVKEVKLDIIRAILMPIQDIFSLNFGVLNQILIHSGYAQADLITSGTRQNSQIDGVLNFRDTKAEFIGIAEVLDNLSGIVKFSGKNIEFETTSAFIKRNAIKIKGSAVIFGAFDINISSLKIETQRLVSILSNSELLKPVFDKYNHISFVQGIKGVSEILIKIRGDASKSNALDFGKASFSGKLKLSNNSLFVKEISNTLNISSALIEFDKKNLKMDLNARVLDSFFNVNYVLNDNLVKVSANSDKFLLADILDIVPHIDVDKKVFVNNKNTSFVKFVGLYDGKIDKLNFDKIKLNAILLSDGIAPFYASQGDIVLENSDVALKNLNLNVFDTKIIFDGIISDVFSKLPNYNINFELNNFDISKLNNLDNYKILRDDIVKIISAYERYSGKLSGKLNFKNENITGKVQISDVSFVHKKLQLPISVTNTDVFFNKDVVSIPSVHALIDNVPVLIKLDISNYFKKAVYNGYVTTNLYSSFINKYVNTNLGYPIKLKGELKFKSYFNATNDVIKTTTMLNFPVNSDVSYMGASLDDKEFERELKLDLVQNKNTLKINNADLSKYIKSQNGIKVKRSYVTSSGVVKFLDNDILFNNLNIKTNEPTNSKIFNILFKKSILKNGKFDCALTVNGTYLKPKILGFINLKNLDMPLYATTVKDISAEFKPHNVLINVLGSVYDTKIMAVADVVNKLEFPLHIKFLDINADYLDIENIFNSLTNVSMQNPHNIVDSQNSSSTKFLPSLFFVDNGKISAKKILIRGFSATDLVANISKTNDNLLKIKNLNFNLAQGVVSSNIFYDFNSSFISGNCAAKSLDANQFAQIFLNLKNQIYGELDGTVNFSTNGLTTEARLENLKGSVSFDINDGKMPKLGSLEYLLRAANLIKSGITGFTINNIINLLIPVKTGEFSLIKGDLVVENGLAKNIEITSIGKNLSLYITGNANLMKQDAKMVVLGRLSKKLSTILGPIGNTSLNTLFNFIPGMSIDEQESSIVKELNKIPFLELSDNNDYRFFRATIDGDLNGENYVQTFKWLE